jgi:transposase
MLQPTYVRTLTDEERQQLTAGLRSPDAFVLRRCQIVLASARRERAPQIARSLGCSDQGVRNALQAFNAHGLGALDRRSTRPRTSPAAFCPGQAEQLRALLHQSPRNFGLKTSLWTLPLAAQVSFEQGLTRQRVSGETIRVTLVRLGVQWKRAKKWITSPDPAYERKKGPEIACSE